MSNVIGKIINNQPFSAMTDIHNKLDANVYDRLIETKKRVVAEIFDDEVYGGKHITDRIQNYAENRRNKAISILEDCGKKHNFTGKGMIKAQDADKYLRQNDYDKHDVSDMSRKKKSKTEDWSLQPKSQGQLNTRRNAGDWAPKYKVSDQRTKNAARARISLGRDKSKFHPIANLNTNEDASAWKD